MKVKCARLGCNKMFKPEGNCIYCSKECSLIVQKEKQRMWRIEHKKQNPTPTLDYEKQIYGTSATTCTDTDFIEEFGCICASKFRINKGKYTYKCDISKKKDTGIYYCLDYRLHGRLNRKPILK